MRAERLISAVFKPASDGTSQIDNSGAGLRAKFAAEAEDKQRLLTELNAAWDVHFASSRAKQAAEFRSSPLNVGDLVRTELQRTGKLDPRWSADSRPVSAVRNNVVFVAGDTRPYHASQVKRVRSATEEGGGETEEVEEPISDVESEIPGAVDQQQVEDKAVAEGTNKQDARRDANVPVALRALYAPRHGRRVVRPTSRYVE